MPMTTILSITLHGEMDQNKLVRFRELAHLTPSGRLTDTEDAKFGYRYLGAGYVSLWRDADTQWGVDLDYENTPPSPEEVAEVRTQIETAAAGTGLTITNVRIKEA